MIRTLPIPTLTTDRLILREPREADFAAMLAFNDSPRAAFVGGGRDRQWVWRGLLANIGHWSLRGHGFYSVDTTAGDFIGRIGVIYHDGWDEPELGWHLFDGFEGRGYGVEAARDVAALGNAEQREQWARIQRAEQALESEPPGEETDALRNRLRLVKGALFWRLAENYRAAMFGERRALREVDGLLRETQDRWERLGRARDSVPSNTGEFGARLDSAEQRLASIQQRLAAAKTRQNQYLAQIAIDALREQKDRIGTYEVQARFALAAIYDRAATPSRSAAPGADGEPPAPEASQPAVPASSAPPAGGGR
jgi:hypothetical protein